MRCAVASRRRRERGGFAILLVLGVVVLAAILVAAFLARADADLKVVKLQTDQAGARRQAENVVRLMEGQITSATVDSAGAWASQPGLIRTFPTAAGSAAAPAYKLYSNRNLRAAKGADFAANADLPAPGWEQQPALYADLNAPVNGQYPILDAHALDPAASILENVTTSAATTSAGVSPAVPAAGNPAPMPVQWLYVRQDGSYAGWGEGSSDRIAVFADANTSPIVARVAFWTDDETCKVNINTATEGQPWEQPRTQSLHDAMMAQNAPVAREFNRHPGHPATTSLSAIFGPRVTGAVSDDEVAKFFINASPQVNFGGSQAGLFSTAAFSPGIGSWLSPLTAGNRRLYASVDEYLFAATSRAAQSLPAGAPALTGTALAQARFFATAHSSSPDLTLFGTPRLSIWPVNSQPNSGGDHFRTEYDEKIVQASTLKGAGYYVQRRNPWTCVDDAAIARNADLFRYAQNLTALAVPGYGHSFAGKYSQDRDQILAEIFDHIRCTNLVDPTLREADLQIDATTGAMGAPSNAQQHTFTGVYTSPAAGVTPISIGSGQVAPLRFSPQAGGFGRFPTFSGATLVFIAVAEPKFTPAQSASNSLTPLVPSSAPDHMWTVRLPVRAMLLFDLFAPSAGRPAFTPSFSIEAEITQPFGVSNSAGAVPITFTWTGLGATSANRARMDISGWTKAGGATFGGHAGSVFAPLGRNISTPMIPDTTTSR